MNLRDHMKKAAEQADQNAQRGVNQEGLKGGAHGYDTLERHQIETAARMGLTKM